MKLYILSKQSLKAIFANKGRSFLTILGIVIGIGSVIALMSLGNGVKDNISSQIATLGTTTLTIMPGAGFAQETSSSSGSSSPGGNQGIGARRGGGFGSTSSLTVADYNSLLDKKTNPNLAEVGGSVSGSGIYNSSQRFSVSGVTPSIFNIRNLSINQGRVINDNDLGSKNKVVDIGSDLKTQLFTNDDAINKTLTIGNDTYTIIGVFNKVSENTFSNPNFIAYIPYTSAFDSLGNEKFNTLIAVAKDENAVSLAKTDIQNTLLTDHGIKDIKLADFSVSTPADLLSTVGNITTTMTSLLAGIAAISLLVGGIGIMNIMLVSVTERTREIGLRKAVGATTSDILIQFLIEAILLTVTGGIVGIALGYLMAKIAGHFVGFAPITSNSSILLAVGISTFIGLLFGIYPAAKAARLNPIDALRYE